MPKEGDISNSQQQPEGKTRYNKEQYDMLKRCSDKKDMTEWNEWRKDRDDEIYLIRAPMQGFWLGHAHLEHALRAGTGSCCPVK